MGKVISQIKTINTVLSENFLHKINKKRELPLEYHKSKIKLFKNFTSEVFEVSNRPVKNLNWLKHL